MIKNKRIKILTIFIMLFVALSSWAYAESNKVEFEIVNNKYKKWTIKFSKEIDFENFDSAKIYIDANYGGKHPVEILQIGSNEIEIIPLKEYTNGQIYTLVIEKGLVDKDGVVSKKNYYKYFRVEDAEVNDSEFKIEKVFSAGNRTIMVFFTREITDLAKLPLFYELRDSFEFNLRGSNKNMEVLLNPYSKKGIIIRLYEKSLTDGDTYSFRVLGELQDVNGEQVNGGDGHAILFESNDKKMKKLSVANVQNLTNQHIMIKFSKPIENENATKISSYTVMQGEKIIAIEKIIIEDKKNIVLKVDTLLERGKEYLVHVKQVDDYLEKSEIKNESYSFEVTNNESNTLKMSAEVEDRNIIKVNLHKKYSENDLSNRQYYVLKAIENKGYSSRNPSKVFYDSDNNVVYLYFTKNMSSKIEYELTVNRLIKDYIEDTAVKDLKLKVTGTSYQDNSIEIRETSVSGNNITVKFDKPILNGGDNLISDKYKITVDNIVIKCDQVKLIDEKTLLLKFSNLSLFSNYKLEISDIENFWGVKCTVKNGGIVINN